jgi:anti-sigma factor RsiW
MAMRDSCEAIEPLLAPYEEPDTAGVLSADDCARVAAHLEACPPCREQVQACRQARAALRAHAAELSPRAPDRLAARCRAAAAGAAGPRRAARWAGWSAAAAAAAALAFFFLMPAHAIATQLAVDHLKCAKFARGSALTGTSGELEHAWRAKRHPAVSIPPGSDSDGLQLIGLRRCVSTEGTMAHVMYTSRGAPLSLFIYRAGAGARPAMQQLETVGHKTILWTAGADIYALVGRGPDLPATARFMQQQLQRRNREP